MADSLPSGYASDPSRARQGSRLDVREGASPAPAPATPKAVALQWDRSPQSAPKVVATGQGHLAEQILELAFAHGVRVREDADLVELLYALDMDSPIPMEAYMAVAEILSYVYRANDAVRRGRPVEEAAS